MILNAVLKTTKIDTFFRLLVLLIVFLMALILYEISELYNATNKLAKIEHERYEMTIKADELRQSSDDLTRMARSFAVTHENEYKKNYYKILDIRNGKAARPQNYEGIYWDLNKKLREERHPDGKKESLLSEMRLLPYSAYEFSKLNESKQNSDRLTQLETEILQNRVNHPVAQLYSHAYYHAKEQIMLPIDEFLLSLKHRTQKEIVETNKEIKKIYQRLFSLFAVSFVVLLFIVFAIKRKILNPIEYLSQTIKDIQEAKDVSKQTFYNDELGEVIQQFFIMKEKIDRDNEQLKKLATTDSLTKIYNRRAFFEIANSFFLLSKRTKKGLALMIFDIDFFKKVNDRYGHVAGDAILIHLTELVKKRMRGSDVFARYGGEEFVVLLPEISQQHLKEFANEIRKLVEKSSCRVDDKTKIGVTLSIGATLFKEDDSSFNEMLLRADEALYEAKSSGRNQVKIKL